MMAAVRFAKFTRTVQRRELRGQCAPKFRVITYRVERRGTASCQLLKH
ncbi:hypothetical protein FHS25_003658 [Rhizobium laguerreae]|uniref:Uncharacterized protein n=1 Tax=Rhizobium laguerreae TaxID=1076926 RepID=A0ABR6GA76_9HYPH|nr:hypothetical protein [Rhizobium laguerreae]